MESGGISNIQGAVSCSSGVGCVSILTGTLDGPTGQQEVSCVLFFWVVPPVSKENGLERAQLELWSLWQSLQVSHSFRSSFVLQNLDTVAIVDLIRLLFDLRAK